jgi:hypothetical protein
MARRRRRARADIENALTGFLDDATGSPAAPGRRAPKHRTQRHQRLERVDVTEMARSARSARARPARAVAVDSRGKGSTGRMTSARSTGGTQRAQTLTYTERHEETPTDCHPGWQLSPKYSK